MNIETMNFKSSKFFYKKIQIDVIDWNLCEVTLNQRRELLEARLALTTTCPHFSHYSRFIG